MRDVLQDWVSAAAGRRPDARAVVGQDETLTYGQIASRASRLALLLRAHGCRRRDRVAILMPKRARAVGSFVGVLEAGCVYVPVDPVGAPARNAQILRQCEPKVVLAGGCDPAVVEDLRSRGALDGAVVGWLDTDTPPPCAAFRWSDVETMPEGGRPADGRPEDPAYILFTSGTSGSPKGVPITHANVRPFIQWAVECFGLTAQDRLSAHASLTFDLSTFDIYAAFAAGAELHQVPRSVRLLPHGMPRFIRDRGLTVWFSVPTQLRYVHRFDALGDISLPSLRHMIWCGDVLPTADLLYWKERLPDVAFTNLYGPTETTVASSYHRVPDDFSDPAAAIPIGVACPGEELVILDEALEPVEDGVAGDIYIGGVGLSPGYWRDPERTRAAFVRDPRNGDGRRLYRTGDRGRRDPDGTVHFLGRADFQIKTSGHRIEPIEVENAIDRLEEVTASVVVPVPIDDFSGSIVACAYVPANGHPLSPGELKQRLTDGLPSYMIPTRWRVVDRLPLNERGKVDRARAQDLLGGTTSR